VKPGDLISIPLNEDMAALAQVVVAKQHGIVVLAIFSATTGGLIGDQLSNAPSLVVETMGGRIRTGEWKKVGRSELSSHVPIPVYVIPVGLERTPYLRDVNGNLVRPATEEEARTLRRPKSFSPALVEEAVRAVNGLSEWLPLYDDMRPSWELSAQAVLDLQ
jgi:hypothetical protein